MVFDFGVKTRSFSDGVFLLSKGNLINTELKHQSLTSIAKMEPSTRTPQEAKIWLVHVTMMSDE
jgi:hypothetical protein